MKLNAKKSTWLQPKRLTALTLTYAMLAQLAMPAWATVAQAPVIYAAPPDPNVMFTLDDSGSMQSEALPDLSSDSTGLLGDASSAFYSLSKYPNMWGSGSGYYALDYFKLTGTSNAIKAGRFLRSPHGNPLYYDYRVTYTPWPSASNDKTLNAAATPSAVRISTDTPFSGGYTLDLTKRVNITGNAATGDDETKNFWPATYFVYTGATPLRSGTPGDANNVAGKFVKREIKSATLTPTFPRATVDDNRTDCGSATTCTYAQELQNFANWLQYYRNRRLMAKGAIATAFSKQGTNLRVGFASINSSPIVRRGVSQFSGTNRTAFYNDLYPLGNGASPYTPLRKAMDDVGKYFMRSNVGNPWAEDPTSSSVGTEYSCRKSFHILSTDGYWNDAAATSPANSNNDNFSGFTPYKPDGTTRYAYADVGPNSTDPLIGRFKINPFKDSYADTLADVAAYYWKTDLRTNLANDVFTSKRDPAFWQHLTTFTVGLGIEGTGTIRRSDTNALIDLSDQATVDALIAMAAPPALSWADPGSGDNATTGDDLIHAAMNGRGRSFSASDPRTLANGLTSALAEVTSQPNSSSNIESSSKSVGVGDIYQAIFNPDGWYGRLYAYKEDASGVIADDPNAARWEAASKMPLPDSRYIYTWDALAATKVGVPFKWASLNATQKTYLNNDSNVLDYLRGKSTNEVQNGGSFRDRLHVGTNGGFLGDIVNSSPVKGPDAGGGYDKLKAGSAGQGTYLTYRSASTTALDNMRTTLFVGANDGMLHAFNTADGEERFAFVPNSVFNVRTPGGAAASTEMKLNLMTSPVYQHRYTVDGPLQIGDSYFGTDDTITGWHTVLIQSAGAGARSVFAIDVTDPKVGAGGFGASKILWEFSEADDSDMGFITGYPHIARIRVGGVSKSVAIFGNGYDSVNGRATLYIVDIQTGAVIWKQAVGAAGGNGLSQPNFVVDSNREVQTVYAGDLKGNLWKFDVSDQNNKANWKVAFGSAPNYAPLYAGSYTQPITVMPEITYHPSGGALVSFGTGKLFESEDVGTTVSTNNATSTYTGNINLRTQTIYGIWDKPSETVGLSGTSLLVAQADATLTAAGFKSTSTNAVDYTAKRGWYLPLASSGERVNVNPLQVNSILLVVANTPDANPCGKGGNARLFILDPLTGGAPNFALFDTDGDQTVTNADTKGVNVVGYSSVVASLPLLQSMTAPSGSSGGVTSEPVWNNRGQSSALAGGVKLEKTTGTNCLAEGNIGTSQPSVESTQIRTCPPTTGRVSWRQLK